MILLTALVRNIPIFRNDWKSKTLKPELCACP